MKAKRLLLSILLSVMLIASFTPTIAFGETNDGEEEITVDQ